MARGKKKGPLEAKKAVFSKIIRSLAAASLLILFFWGIWQLAGKLEKAPEERPLPAVVIDAGHGGIDGGTVGLDGLLEKNPALTISFLVKDHLEAAGVKVAMTRTTDVTLSISDRVAFANAEPRRALVSIHLNSGPPSARGTETLYAYPKAIEAQQALRHQIGAPTGAKISDTRGDMLALAIQESVCAVAKSRNRGTKNRPNLGVIRRTHCPSVLVETGFVTHHEENKKLSNPSYHKKLAQGIANGILLYLQEVDLHPDYGITVMENPT